MASRFNIFLPAMTAVLLVLFSASAFANDSDIQGEGTFNMEINGLTASGDPYVCGPNEKGTNYGSRTDTRVLLAPTAQAVENSRKNREQDMKCPQGKIPLCFIDPVQRKASGGPGAEVSVTCVPNQKAVVNFRLVCKCIDAPRAQRIGSMAETSDTEELSHTGEPQGVSSILGFERLAALLPVAASR